MAAEYDSKAVLLELGKQDGNKQCIDCGSPMPQWASVNFGAFVCLSCSGQHRGLGVHITFVRSLTMDKWTDEQVKKMKVGGNLKALAFFEKSSEYSKDMPIPQKYNSHFASQYKEKLAAECEGREWTPSDPPAAAPASSGTLRKPKAQMSRGSSPVPRSGSGASTPTASGASGGIANPFSDKAKNESYFAGLGAANASRPDDLPPSQGGRYGGFGSTPSPSTTMSSKALPTMDDLRDDPMTAVSRGWGFFSATLAMAGKTINDSVIQPGMARAADPNLQSQLYGYASTAGAALSQGARVGSEALATGMRAGGSAIKNATGTDVGDMGASYIERYSGRGTGQGYSALGSDQSYNVPSASAQEAGWADMRDDDFFDSHLSVQSNGGASGAGAAAATPVVTSPPAGGSVKRKVAAKGKKADDDWGNFDDGWKDD